MALRRDGKDGAKKQMLRRLAIFIVCVGLGALPAWLLYDFNPPGGVFVMAGTMAAWIIDQLLHWDDAELFNKGIPRQ